MDTLTMPPALLGPAAPPAQNAPISQADSQARERVARQRLVLGLLLTAALACVLAAAALAVALRRHGPLLGPRYRTETVLRGPVTGVLSLPARVLPTAEVRV